MPCSDGGPSREEIGRENFRYEILLCSACSALENFNFNFALNPELDEWWDKHKKVDEARIARELKEKLEREHAVEIAKKKTINQLTKEEKALLRKHNLL